MKQFNVITIITALIVTLQAPLMFGQETAFAIYHLDPSSRLWLEGTATIGDFTCSTARMEGMAVLQEIHVEKYDSLYSVSVHNEVRVSMCVRSFDCGNHAMNEDMYEAMKSDSFPTIEFELIDATLASDTGSADSVRDINTIGKLTIAGITKTVPMSIAIKQSSPERFTITGSKALSMTDFGITPPTALWGIIKTKDRLTVNFQLIAVKNFPEPQQK